MFVLLTESLPAQRTDPQPSEGVEGAQTVDFMYAAEDTTVANQTSTPSRQLPVIIAGSLTGACILLIILVFLLCRCYRARRETRAKYCKYMPCTGWFLVIRQSPLYRVLCCLIVKSPVKYMH